MSNLEQRLGRYNKAALATAVSMGVAGMSASANAAQVTISPVNLPSSGSVELFLGIQGFVPGAVSVGYSVATSAFSAASPLGGTATDIMLRGAFATNTGTGQIRGNNGAMVAVVSQFVNGPNNTGTYAYAVNVGGAFSQPGGGAGTYLFGAPGPGAPTYNAFLTWPWNQGNGQFGNPGSGVAYFQFINNMDGLVYDGWLDISISAGGSNNLLATITAIHIDTGGSTAVPEPSSMALLCLGAAGLGAFRRRRKTAH